MISANNITFYHALKGLFFKAPKKNICKKNVATKLIGLIGLATKKITFFAASLTLS